MFQPEQQTKQQKLKTKVSPKKRENKSTKRALSPPSEASDLDEVAPPPPKTSKKPTGRAQTGGFDEDEDKGSGFTLETT